MSLAGRGSGQRSWMLLMWAGGTRVAASGLLGIGTRFRWVVRRRCEMTGGSAFCSGLACRMKPGGPVASRLRSRRVRSHGQQENISKRKRVDCLEEGVESVRRKDGRNISFPWSHRDDCVRRRDSPGEFTGAYRRDAWRVEVSVPASDWSFSSLILQ